MTFVFCFCLVCSVYDVLRIRARIESGIYGCPLVDPYGYQTLWMLKSLTPNVILFAYNLHIFTLNILNISRLLIMPNKCECYVIVASTRKIQVLLFGAF